MGSVPLGDAVPPKEEIPPEKPLNIGAIDMPTVPPGELQSQQPETSAPEVDTKEDPKPETSVPLGDAGPPKEEIPPEKPLNLGAIDMPTAPPGEVQSKQPETSAPEVDTKEDAKPETSVPLGDAVPPPPPAAPESVLPPQGENDPMPTPQDQPPSSAVLESDKY